MKQFVRVEIRVSIPSDRVLVSICNRTNTKRRSSARSVSIPSDRVLVSIKKNLKEDNMVKYECLNPLRSGLGFNFK